MKSFHPFAIGNYRQKETFEKIDYSNRVGINTEKDRKGPKRTEKDRKGTEKDRKGTEKDRKARNHLLFTEKEGECS